MGTGGVADDFDGWSLDDDFVRSGPHEPPARTRAAIARHGGQQTSWRQPGTPVGAENLGRPAGVGERSLVSSGSIRSRRHASRNRWLLTGLAGALGVLGALQLLTHSGAGVGRRIELPTHAAPARTIGQVAAASGGSSQPTKPDSDEVHGISPSTPTGSCFTSTFSAQGRMNLDRLSCAAPHDFELVSIDQAAGSSASYPAAAYWQSTVLAACRQDLRGYARPGTDNGMTAGRQVSFFRPTRSGWSFGDRTIYCVVHSSTPQAGTVRR